MRITLLFLGTLLTGCAMSHTLGDRPLPDGGPPGDGGSCGPGGPTVICFVGCSDAGRAPICVDGAWECPPGTSSTPPTDCCWGPAPRPGDCACISGTWICEGPDGGPGCGDLWAPSCWTSCDTLTSALCVGSDWVCPPGSSTSPPPSCCSPGAPPPAPGCVCDGWTWSCPPAVDAGVFECPTDPSVLLGSACDASLSGTTCGTCDPCGPCNQAACDGHSWYEPPAIELPCPAFDTFACGPTASCVRFAEVCLLFRSDTPPSPDTYSCSAFPTGCAPTSGCGCFSVPSGLCTDDGTGGVTVNVPSGG